MTSVDAGRQDELFDFGIGGQLYARTYSALRREGIRTISDVEELLENRREIRGIGKAGWKNLTEAYQRYQLEMIAELQSHAY